MLSLIISKYKGIVAGLILLPIVFYFIYQSLDKEVRVKDSSKLDPIEQISEYWRFGKYEKKALDQCSDIPLSSDFIKCHPEPLLCQLKYSGVKINSYELRNNGDLYLTLNQTRILLKNRCHRVALHENIYSAGPRDYSEQIWDNLGQDIFIDRFYVNNFEVVRWRNQSLKLSYKESIKPATGLSLEERHEYCFAQGGHLLQSHVMDAASFFPQTGPIALIKKSIYPWSKANKLKKDCESFRFAGCSQVSAMERVGTSWSGVFHVIGSLPEVFENPFMPEANLKVSSQFLPVENPWHQLGLRASWLGRSEFDFKEKYLGKLDQKQEVKGVAFRCMYY